MDEFKITVFERRFLVEGLPESVKPSDHHIQIFDNCPCDSDLRLRKTRDPQSDVWEFLLDKSYPEDENLRRRVFSRILLSKYEYSLLDGLRGRETRKNRYLIDNLRFYIDIYLGPLWGLNIATFRSANEAETADFTWPATAHVEITGDSFFMESKLPDLDFNAVRTHLALKKKATE